MFWSIRECCDVKYLLHCSPPSEVFLVKILMLLVLMLLLLLFFVELNRVESCMHLSISACFLWLLFICSSMLAKFDVCGELCNLLYGCISSLRFWIWRGGFFSLEN